MTASKWIILISVAVIVIAFLVSMLTLRKKRKSVSVKIPRINPKNVSKEGLQIPVLRTYSGLKMLAPVTFLENKISPRLFLFDDHLVYRVLRKRSVPYDKIEAVESYTSKYYNKLQFNFIDSGMFLMAVFGNQETLKSVLDFLAKKGVYPRTGDSLRF